MTFTTHLIAGSAIGALSGNIPGALVGGIASHYLLDMIPHFDAGWIERHPDVGQKKWTKKLWTAVWIDVVIGAFIFLWLTPASVDALPLVAGGVGGLLPDLLDNVPWWRNIWHSTRLGVWESYWHDQTHFAKIHRRQWLFAIISQLAILAGAIYILNPFA